MYVQQVFNPYDRCALLYGKANSFSLWLFPISVQYLAFLYQYIKEWRQNPQWSFTCCLALLLPLNDLQGEIREMATKNITKTQLQTGAVEKPSITTSAKDSGAIDVTLKSGDSDTMPELKKQSSKATMYSKTTCQHQGAQTELSSIPVPVAMRSVVRHPVVGTRQNFL